MNKLSPSFGSLGRVCYIWVMSIGRFFFSLLVGVLPFQTTAQGAIEQLSYVMCKSQKTVRTIRVTSSNEVCQTVYTKAGVDRIVSSGKSRQSCIGVMKNIRDNLEDAAWRCKDISSANVSNDN